MKSVPNVNSNQIVSTDEFIPGNVAVDDVLQPLVHGRRSVPDLLQDRLQHDHVVEAVRGLLEDVDLVEDDVGVEDEVVGLLESDSIELFFV